MNDQREQYKKLKRKFIFDEYLNQLKTEHSVFALTFGLTIAISIAVCLFSPLWAIPCLGTVCLFYAYLIHTQIMKNIEKNFFLKENGCQMLPIKYSDHGKKKSKQFLNHSVTHKKSRNHSDLTTKIYQKETFPTFR